MDFGETLDMVHLWWLLATNQRATQSARMRPVHAPPFTVC